MILSSISAGKSWATFIDVIKPLDTLADYPVKTRKLFCDDKSEFFKLPISKPFFTASEAVLL
jgi:hypothetical protein